MLVWSVEPTATTTTGTKAKQCGKDESTELDHSVRIDLPWHTSSTLTLRITSSLDQPATDEWFGFTDLIIGPYIRNWPSVDTFTTVSEGKGERALRGEEVAGTYGRFSRALMAGHPMSLHSKRPHALRLAESWVRPGRMRAKRLSLDPRDLKFPFFSLPAGGYDVISNGYLTKTYTHLPPHTGKLRAVKNC